jgi:glutamyl-tRNA synthetase
MGVDQVVRGEDLIPSTFRQIQLYQFFGWPVPHHAHLPLLIGPDGRRLAKRHGDTRLAWFRDQGVPASRVLGALAWWSGVRPTAAPVAHPLDLLADFAWERLNPAPVVVGERERQALVTGLSEHWGHTVTERG